MTPLSLPSPRLIKGYIGYAQQQAHALDRVVLVHRRAKDESNYRTISSSVKTQNGRMRNEDQFDATGRAHVAVVVFFLVPRRKRV